MRGGVGDDVDGAAACDGASCGGGGCEGRGHEAHGEGKGGEGEHCVLLGIARAGNDREKRQVLVDGQLVISFRVKEVGAAVD